MLSPSKWYFLLVLHLIVFLRSAILKEVPYSRLLEANLSTKLDSDSKLQCETSKLTISGDGAELLPKNSVSDSKLAVDYFNSPTEVRKSPMSQSVSKIIYLLIGSSLFSIFVMFYSQVFNF